MNRAASRAAARPPAWRDYAPGITLTGVIALTAWAMGTGLERLLGRVVLEPVVLAILIGMCVRAVRVPRDTERAGMAFAGKQLLELSVVLLGAGANVTALLQAGPLLAAGIAGLVLLTLILGTLWGRALGLSTTHALLIACGNAICGNSAIAAVAPVLGAKREDVASAVAYTAVLGVAVILGLPVLQHWLALTDVQYGVVVGLTVYAVPQVLAAAFPVSVHAGEIGMLVKLARVLLLGPIALGLSLWRHTQRSGVSADRVPLVPWFVIGFLVAAALRSSGVIAEAVSAPLRDGAKVLTLLAMASLGLGVELGMLRRAGPKVVVAVTGSLALLLAGSLLLALHVLPR